MAQGQEEKQPWAFLRENAPGADFTAGFPCSNRSTAGRKERLSLFFITKKTLSGN